MNINRLLLISLTVLSFLNLSSVVESALPFGIFPLLTSGWYYKPSPVESVIFGLIVVKVLAIRLASVTGILPIPYHLNDLFVRSLGKRSVHEYFSQIPGNLTMPQSSSRPDKPFSFQSVRHGDYPRITLNTTVIEPTELKSMFRLLSGVRRLDSSDCFMKTLCILGYETSKSEDYSLWDRELIETINFLTSMEEVMTKSQVAFSKPSIMDVFQKALALGKESRLNTTSVSCDMAYSMCPLEEREMKFESLLSDLS